MDVTLQVGAKETLRATCACWRLSFTGSNWNLGISQDTQVFSQYCALTEPLEPHADGGFVLVPKYHPTWCAISFGIWKRQKNFTYFIIPYNCLGKQSLGKGNLG